MSNANAAIARAAQVIDGLGVAYRKFTSHSGRRQVRVLTLGNEPVMAGLSAKHLILAGVITIVAAGLPVRAQSVTDFRLQPGTSPSVPRPQGPVDPETPGMLPDSTPATAPDITPTASSVPVTAPPPQAPRIRSLPAPSPTQSLRVAAPLGAASAAANVGQETAAAAAAAVLPDAPLPALTPAVTETAAPLPYPPPAGANSGETAWLWWLAVLVVIGVLTSFRLLRRRVATSEPESDVPCDEPPSGMAKEPVSNLPQNLHVLTGAAEPLGMTLMPVRLSVSLVHATLLYELAVTNTSGAAVGPIAVAADMIGAHASLPEESQLAQDGTGLELIFELPLLGPDQTAHWKGEMRLPLSSITPIRAGAATLLVPLLRIRAEAPGWSTTRAVVVGETPSVPGGRLRPFRLDTGPRIYAEIEQREVAAAP